MARERDDDFRDDNDRDDAPRRRGEDEWDRPRAAQKNGMATASLVLGVLSLCGGITAIPGLICGIVGLGRAKSRGGAGQGMAIAGTVLSGLGILAFIPLMIGLLLPAVMKVREASSRMGSSNNLKQISLGLLNSEGSNSGLPKPYFYGGPNGGEPEKLVDRLSWRVGLLPYIEQDNLQRAFRLGEPWNSATNQPLSNQIVRPYTDPNEQEPNTRYRVFYGGGAAYDLVKTMAIARIRDGASNTISFVEGGEKVTWSQFNDYPFSMDGPLPALGRPGVDTFNAAMFDGSVRAFRKTIDPKVLKSAIHASDNVGLPIGE